MFYGYQSAKVVYAIYKSYDGEYLLYAVHIKGLYFEWKYIIISMMHYT